MSPVSVPDAIESIGNAVRRGYFAQASTIANSCTIPLGLTPAQVTLGRLISTGAESAVYEGTYQGTKVAVKRPRITNAADLKRFRQELRVLAQLKHAGIIKLLGAKALPPDYSLVLPWYPHVLSDELHRHGWRPIWQEVVHTATQLASALVHTHEEGIIHRDLKTGNVLLSEDRQTAVLIDFGIAAYSYELDEDVDQRATAKVLKKPTGGYHKTQLVGTLEYMAPEVLQKHPHSTHSDVYALATTINEVATRTIPFSDCTMDNPKAHTILEMGYGRQELAAAVCTEGLRPLLRDDTPPALVHLLEACWRLQPTERPSAKQVLTELQHLASACLPAPLTSLSDPTLSIPTNTIPTNHIATNSNMPKDSPSNIPTQNATPRSVPTRIPTPTISISTVAVPTSNAVSTIPIPSNIPSNPTLTKPTFPTNHIPTNSFPTNSAPMKSASVPTATADGISAQRNVQTKGVCPAENGVLTPLGSERVQDWSAVWTGGLSDGSGYTPEVKAGSYKTPGRRGDDKMEDTCVVASPLQGPSQGPIEGPKRHFLAVFDGHRGAETAEFAAVHVVKYLGRAAAGKCGPEEALKLAFMHLDADFRKQQDARWARYQTEMHGSATKRPWPGACALAVLIAGQMLYCANAGDCRAVLCRRGKAVAISRDHTGALADERQRVQRAGASVTWIMDGWRIGSAGLQVTRSLGDADLKHCGVTAEPEVQTVQIQPEDEFVVLATDGLWDKVSDQEVVDLVHDTVKQPAMSAQRLAQEALARGGEDNVTVIVAFLRKADTTESIYADGVQKYESHAESYFGTRRAGMNYKASASKDEAMDTY